MKPIAKSILSLAFVFCVFNAVVFAQSSQTVLIVFDSSERMRHEINGQSKFLHAKQFVNDFVKVNTSVRIGLTIFGSDATGGTEAYFSPLPPGNNSVSTIADELDKLNPEGMSPIASALLYGSQSLTPNGINYIIIVTDGVENTGGGPINVAQTLMNRGLITRLDVVGFTDLKEDNPLISELVNAGNGMYVPAWDAERLIQHYSTMLTDFAERESFGSAGYRCFIGSENGFPAYGSTVELFDGTGQKVDTQIFWKGIFENLDPGSYNFIASHQDTSIMRSFEVISGERTDLNFVFMVPTGEFSYLHKIENTLDGKAYGTITRVYHSTGEAVFTGTDAEGIVTDLPEGKYAVEALFEGLPLQTQEVEILNGTQPQLEFQFNVGRGRIAYQCFLDLLQTNVASGTQIKIFRQPYNELALEESQWRGTTTYLPIGLYTVEGNYKGIIRRENIEVHSDSTSTLDFTFNIEQVRFSFQCFASEAKKVPATGVLFQVYNQDGVLIEESNTWRGNFQLPEGVYSIQAHFEGKTKTQTLNLFASSQQNIIIIDFEK